MAKPQRQRATSIAGSLPNEYHGGNSSSNFGKVGGGTNNGKSWKKCSTVDDGKGRTGKGKAKDNIALTIEKQQEVAKVVIENTLLDMLKQIPRTNWNGDNLIKEARRVYSSKTREHTS